MCSVNSITLATGCVNGSQLRSMMNHDSVCGEMIPGNMSVGLLETVLKSVISELHTGPTPDVIVWRAISYDSKSALVVVPNAMIASKYEGRMVNFVLMQFMGTTRSAIFQQNNALFHTAAIT